MAKIDQLTETEVAYLAGLIDGEGTIGMGRTSARTGDQGVRYRVTLTVAATTDMDLVSWLSSKLGVGVYRVGTPKSYKHKQGWCFKLSEGPAEQLLARALPCLVVKKRQAELFLRYRAVQRACGPEVRWSRESMLALRVLRGWFFIQFRQLNAKGPESVTTNTPDAISEDEIVKIESVLQGNLQRVTGDSAPPAGLIQ
jgi:hypothetical protein